MKKNIFNKNIIFFYILLIIFKLSLNEDINLSEGETPFFGVNEERYVSFYLNEEIKNKLNNTYIHFYTYPQNSDNINSQQIIFSSIKEKPQASNAENYSYKFSKNANLFINYNNIKNNNIFYLTIKCFKYPCYFILVTKFEKNYANLNLNDDYSYFISGQKFNTMKFKIPSSLSKEYSKNKKHSLTISVTNPTDADSINLYLLKNNEINNLNVDNFKTPMGKIFTFIEENINKSPNNSYILEIESIQNQFISISIKTSIYDENSKKLINEIIPNSNPKYTYINNFNNIIIKEECFKINENYLKDNLISDDNDNFLYASIEFFTSPNYGYLNYGGNKELHKINNNKESLNIVLNKESNKYPDLCFNTSERLEYSFMIQINHISKKNENIDINYPLTSGFIHSRIVPIDNLLIYTHYSDIHFSDKLSYNFRVVKGQPEIYIYNCKTYPKCYNNITELRNNKDITKLEFKENINYFHIYNINKEKDLAPYGPNQNLLYIFCPKNNTNFCELDILVYTNYDQIILPSTNNNTFYSNLKKKDEKDLYKFHISKGKKILKKIEINLNISNDNALFESALEDNKTILLSNQSNKTNMQIIEFKTINSTLNNDLDIPFNIKSKKDNLYYKFEYKLLYDEKKEDEKKEDEKKEEQPHEKTDNKNFTIKHFEFGKFFEIKDINSFPIRLETFPFEENNKFNINKELLFNLEFYNLNINNKIEYTYIFNELEINATLIDNNKLSLIKENKKDEDLFNNKILKAKFDISTKTVFLDIKKDNLLKLWNNNTNNENNNPILYLSINNKTNINNNFKNLIGKIILFYKNDTQFIIPQNKYINDKLYIDSYNNNYNFYRLHLNNDNDKFVVDLSLNYDLNKGIYISFLDYENINNITENDLMKNSSNIETIKADKNKTIFHFEFKLKNNKKDIILCIKSKVKPQKITEKKLNSINYIFKYNTFKIDSNEDKNRIKYIFNKEININNNNDKTIIEIKGIKKEGESEILKNIEIYVRKILKNDKINEEELDTIGIIESKYELIEGKIIFDNETIKIEIPKINEEDYYSILFNLPKENEKFVFNTINNIKSRKNIWDDKWILIIIISGIISIIIILIIIIIVIVSNYKNKDLKEKIIQTSFKKSGVTEKLYEDDEILE